jgi:hypothetical protein
MRRGQPFPFWVAVLTVGLLGHLSPLAPTSTSDPAGSSARPTPDLDDQLLLAADGVLVDALAVPPLRAVRRT